MTRGYGIINHTFDSYQPMVQVKLAEDTKVFLYQWNQEKLPHMVSCKLKTGEQFLLNRERKFTRG